MKFLYKTYMIKDLHIMRDEFKKLRDTLPRSITAHESSGLDNGIEINIPDGIFAVADLRTLSEIFERYTGLNWRK